MVHLLCLQTPTGLCNERTCFSTTSYYLSELSPPPNRMNIYKQRISAFNWNQLLFNLDATKLPRGHSGNELQKFPSGKFT